MGNRFPNLKGELKPVPEIPPLMRGCNDCGIKHLVQDCPKVRAKQGIVTLNCVEAIPLSNPASSSDSGEVVPLNAITRAQKAKNDAIKENDTEKTPSEKSAKTKESWKARRARRAASKKRKEQPKAAEHKENKTGDLELKEKSNEKPQQTPKERVEQPARSVLAEKMHELDTLLQAYKRQD